MARKTAIVILSDPKAGGEEALGRLFNGLAAAWEAKQAGEPVKVVFAGAGTRWVGPVSEASHPAHGLYQSVRDVVAGVSCGCADVFGATDEAQSCGVPLLKENRLPGTPGVASVRSLRQDGFEVLTF